MASIHTCQCIAPLSCVFRTQPENLLPTFFPSRLMQLGKLLLSLPIGHAHLNRSPSRLSSHVILDCVKLRIIAHLHTRMRFLLFLESAISILYRKGGWSRGNHDFFFYIIKNMLSLWIFTLPSFLNWDFLSLPVICFWQVSYVHKSWLYPLYYFLLLTSSLIDK